MNHLDSELEDDDDELQLEEFRFHELLQRPVIHLFLVIISNNPINNSNQRWFNNNILSKQDPKLLSNHLMCYHLMVFKPTFNIHISKQLCYKIISRRICLPLHKICKVKFNKEWIRQYHIRSHNSMRHRVVSQSELQICPKISSRLNNLLVLCQ